MKYTKKIECCNFGFWQGGYFCDLCNHLSPKLNMECLEISKTNVLKGEITEEMVNKLGYKKLI